MEEQPINAQKKISVLRKPLKIKTILAMRSKLCRIHVCSQVFQCKTKMGDSDSGVGVKPGADSNFDQFGVGVGIGVNSF